ncbi:monodechloroaminopyrrolnitrin synthase PrnB family protein [Streptomyces sp. NPDC057638]|uniref:monodechloroaminopyrrolnitrin synthase PrnB family protein n=1 Tax=Streptomyces sp. NPDC057638 TaxID=3346190 RepID=UPI0036D0F6F9
MSLHDLLAAPGLERRGDPRYRIAAIRAADPLAADALLAAVPAMNARADVRALTTALRVLVPDPEATAAYGVTDALAAMRDLGLLLGSLKRHGVEPLTAVPEALPVLRELGRRTDMVPRDTVHHYTTWNPLGHRQRTYTGDPMEATLQDAVRMVFPGLVASLDSCAELARLEPYDPAFADALDRTAGHVQSMVAAIDLTVAGVDPVFFAREMRCYFEDIDVGGTAYLGPAAAQVPLWLVDLTLWQCDRDHSRYDAFLAESITYSLPSWRAHYHAHKGVTSAVSKLSAALSWEGADDLPPALAHSARALARVLRILKTFRARHITIARKAYSEEVRRYDQGSGGAPVALLREVLDLTRDNETLVRRTPRSPAPAPSSGPGTPTAGAAGGGAAGGPGAARTGAERSPAAADRAGTPDRMAVADRAAAAHPVVPPPRSGSSAPSGPSVPSVPSGSPVPPVPPVPHPRPAPTRSPRTPRTPRTTPEPAGDQSR